METIWHYSKLGNKLVSDVYRRKVTHVVHDNRTIFLNHRLWKGELDDDKYFMVQVLDAVVMLTISEIEGELLTKDPIAVAYADGIKGCFDESDETKKIQKFVIAKSDFIPKFMKNLTFEQIMNVFMWEYASPSVEVYEYFLV